MVVPRLSLKFDQTCQFCVLWRTPVSLTNKPHRMLFMPPCSAAASAHTNYSDTFQLAIFSFFLPWNSKAKACWIHWGHLFTNFLHPPPIEAIAPKRSLDPIFFKNTSSYLGVAELQTSFWFYQHTLSCPQQGMGLFHWGLVHGFELNSSVIRLTERLVLFIAVAIQGINNILQ